MGGPRNEKEWAEERSGGVSDKDLIQALRGAAVETGSLLCLGCGYEHNCGIRGCAIIRAAAERLEELTAPPTAPLTLEELWEMDGKPVWNDTTKKWYFVVLNWEHGPVAVDYKGNWRPLDDRYYRRKPEEAMRSV